ncbi:hypothetical protein CROQUDRAFT_86985 [Cronartium quercuum f. sp. fusiforme G11]|uniref:Transcription activator of gluconeogenesis ERT1 n=1 Tax=Cronartium quercuum f. sp. fusiforme G11 TaxID=708437 RepID=A0A9P6NVZ1_9BASI|nr:hypothetical protein CROQUDRAFT_86985 [Cronartium quercuum f. sp. fusiforme G11]
MNRPPSRSSMYGGGYPLPSSASVSNHTSRPTLPSLRSQVGEYLPEPTPYTSHPSSHGHDPFHSDYHRRQSMSSSSMHFLPSPVQASFPRPPSTDSRRLSSSTSMAIYRTSTPGPHTSSSIHSGSTSYTSGPPPAVNATRSTVSVACTNCRSAHLACSDVRPCRRCVQTGRSATCIDVEVGRVIWFDGLIQLFYHFMGSRSRKKRSLESNPKTDVPVSGPIDSFPLAFHQPRKRGRPRASDMAALNMATTSKHNLNTWSASPSPSSRETDELVIIMSTSLRCALITMGVTQVLGHGSQSILEQPLSTFIHPEDKHEYARFSLGLLAYPGVASRPVPVSAARLHQASLNELLTPLPGAQVHMHTFRLRTLNNSWPSFRFESYLGGGFGAHPAEPDSLRLTYVVLKLTPVSGIHTSNYVAIPSPSARSSSHLGDHRAYELDSYSSYGHTRPPSRSSMMR